jgi:two-component system, NarL family, sensor histidine kinase BarA
MNLFIQKLFFPDIRNERRKRLHYVLLSLIILLQVLVLLIVFNETVNKSKLKSIQSELKVVEETDDMVQTFKNDLATAQEYFHKFLYTKDTSALKNYFSAMNVLTTNLDSLQSIYRENDVFKVLQKRHSEINQSIKLLKTELDSTLAETLNFEPVDDVFQIKQFKEKEILNSVDVESHMVLDSISKKNLFSRLMDAISGKVDIQKETMNIKVTMKYGKEVETGSIEDQLRLAFKNVNQYYQRQFLAFKNKLHTLNTKELELIANNNSINEKAKTILNQFSNYSHEVKNVVKDKLQKQSNTNSSIKNYSIFFLLVVMILITIVLGYFTKINFEYEKQLETANYQIKQNLSFKNRIVGMISHEVRSPLSIISIYSKIISAKTEDEEIKEVFKSVDFTTNSLMMLSNQILEYSKNQYTKIALKPKQFYLNEELEQIINSITTLVESKGNVLQVVVNLQKAYVVNADLTKIHQLLYNIIGNANKFTENGIINLSVKEQFVRNNMLSVLFEIQDTGRGISATDIQYVFDAYQQGMIYNQTTDVGVGLGLNLCKELVELFEGEIHIDSVPDKGTKVSFNLVLELK